MKKLFYLLFSALLGAATVVSCSDDGVEIPSDLMYYPGQTVPEKVISKYGYSQFFTCQPIPDSIFSLMQGKTYKEGCLVERDSLRYITCLHRDKDGNAIVGEMVLNTSIAPTVLDIFRKLYEARYPIERMRLPDYWDADDELQMRDNNTSSFNYRPIAGTQRLSKHSRGVAIDINTLYNPFFRYFADSISIDSTTIQPATAVPYLDRTKTFDYKIEQGDLCYRLFKEAGFDWGGEWLNRKDYQHFELP